MGYRILEPRFTLGRIYRSMEVHRLRIDSDKYLRLHQCGDWGDIPPEQVQTNEHGIVNGTLILSRFHIEASDGREYRVLILTENFRGKTVMMLDYEFDPKLKRPPPGAT